MKKINEYKKGTDSIDCNQFLTWMGKKMTGKIKTRIIQKIFFFFRYS